MSIRREDKEFIQSLSLVGALLGASIGLVVVTHLSRSAHKNYEEVSEYQQTQAALVKLSETVVNPNNPIADENVMKQVHEQFHEQYQQTAQPEAPAKKSFWVQIPRWGYIGICVGVCGGGAILGYCSVTVIGWIGTILVLYLIRLLYLCIRRTAPAYAQSIHIRAPSDDRSQQYERDNGRILPTVVKLMFMLALVLMMLAAVVWHLTAL